MATPGYFYDETSGHTFAGGTPQSVALSSGPNVILSYPVPQVERDFREAIASPLTFGEERYQQGSTIQQLTVKGMCERLFVQGDAEAYAWDLLQWLGASHQGELAVNGQSYTASFFQRGRVEIRMRANSSLIIYELTFIRSHPSSTTPGTPAYATPSVPGEYAGRTTSSNYRATGSVEVTFGHAEIRSISCSRPVHFNKIGRASGVRIVNQPRGRKITFDLQCFIQSYGVGVNTVGRANLEYQIHVLQATLNDQFFTLSGNGNNFTFCQAMQIQAPDNDQYRGAEYSMSVVQESLT